MSIDITRVQGSVTDGVGMDENKRRRYAKGFILSFMAENGGSQEEKQTQTSEEDNRAVGGDR